MDIPKGVEKKHLDFLDYKNGVVCKLSLFEIRLLLIVVNHYANLPSIDIEKVSSDNFVIKYLEWYDCLEEYPFINIKAVCDYGNYQPRFVVDMMRARSETKEVSAKELFRETQHYIMAFKYRCCTN